MSDRHLVANSLYGRHPIPSVLRKYPIFGWGRRTIGWPPEGGPTESWLPNCGRAGALGRGSLEGRRKRHPNDNLSASRLRRPYVRMAQRSSWLANILRFSVSGNGEQPMKMSQHPRLLLFRNFPIDRQMPSAVEPPPLADPLHRCRLEQTSIHELRRIGMRRIPPFRRNEQAGSVSACRTSVRTSSLRGGYGTGSKRKGIAQGPTG